MKQQDENEKDQNGKTTIPIEKQTHHRIEMESVSRQSIFKTIEGCQLCLSAIFDAIFEFVRC